MVLALTALMLVLSVRGAFFGDVSHAKAFFTCAALVVFWLLFAALFVVGLFSFKRLRQSPGLLAVHVGCLLVLLGSFANSDLGNRVAGGVFGIRRVVSGEMTIVEGESSDEVKVWGRERDATFKLPFAVHLHDFTVEYYPVRPVLGAIIPQPPHEAHAVAPKQAVIEWEVGQETAIPGTRMRVKVVEYLPSARAAFGGTEAPSLAVTGADGETIILPAEVGQETALKDPEATVRVEKVFSHLLVKGRNEVVNLEGSVGNPAVLVKITKPDGSAVGRYVYAQHDMHGGEETGIEFEYRVPGDVIAMPDDTTGLPAMEVIVTGPGGTLHGWLTVAPGRDQAGMALADIVEDHSDPDHQHTEADQSPGLVMVNRKGPPSEYTSDLSIMVDGQEAVRKTIQVNDPLHYGGYHFYQYSYDNEHGRYTVLSVTSDLGLNLVFAGFALACGGAFWLFWVQPVLKSLSKR